MDEAIGEEATNWYLTSRILAVNFAAIHTSSMVCRVHGNGQPFFKDFARLSRMQCIIWLHFQNM
jgi:hypothetical protein